jgi:hypothetical protein
MPEPRTSSQRPNLKPQQRELLGRIVSCMATGEIMRDGWVRMHIGPSHPWVWGDEQVLAEHGLIERREDWKDVLVRPTTAGNLLAYAAPQTLMPEVARNARGQSFEGDVLP